MLQAKARKLFEFLFGIVLKQGQKVQPQWSPQLFNIWWMAISVSKGFGPALSSSPCHRKKYKNIYFFDIMSSFDKHGDKEQPRCHKNHNKHCWAAIISHTWAWNRYNKKIRLVLLAPATAPQRIIDATIAALLIQLLWGAADSRRMQLLEIWANNTYIGLCINFIDRQATRTLLSISSKIHHLLSSRGQR